MFAAASGDDVGAIDGQIDGQFEFESNRKKRRLGGVGAADEDAPSPPSGGGSPLSPLKAPREGSTGGGGSDGGGKGSNYQKGSNYKKGSNDEGGGQEGEGGEEEFCGVWLQVRGCKTLTEAFKAYASVHSLPFLLLGFFCFFFITLKPRVQ